jgi:hypothetical protein
VCEVATPDVATVRDASAMSKMPRPRYASGERAGAMALMAHRTQMCAAEAVTSRVPAMTTYGEMEASRTVSTAAVTASAPVTAATAFRQREVISDVY